MNRKIICLTSITITAILMGACKVVKPYQKQYINDYQMQANAHPNEKLESEADGYREGMMGGTDGKSGGGCGCN